MLLLAAALAGGVALRGWLIVGKRTINHDEAISYLCAAGKQGQYQERAANLAPPLGDWTPAAEIKRFFEPEQGPCPGRIARDLTETDIHPPLYFWLLHLWRLTVGVHVWTGPALNALIAAVGMLLLFGLARRVLRDDLTAAAVAALWLLSPAVIETCFEARHYDLLAACTIGYAWALLSCLEERDGVRPARFAALSLATLAGLLTHYHFTLLLAAGGAWLLIALRTRRRPALNGLAAMALGGALFVALHPGFMASIQRAREQSQAGGATELMPRLEAIVLCYSTFFVDTAYNAWLAHKYLPPVGIASLLGLSAAVLVIFRRNRRPDGAPHAGCILYLFLTMAATNAALYLVGVSPKHAMGAMYLSMVWPFLAFLPVLLVRARGRAGTTLTVLLCGAMLISGAAGVQRQVRHWRMLPDPARFLGNAPAVIIDNTARGILPAIVWHVPGGCPVLAAPEAYLLEYPERWLFNLKSGTVLVSATGYGNTPADQERLLQLLAADYEVAPLDKGVFGVGQTYLLTAK
jgi:hypothetical protein